MAITRNTLDVLMLNEDGSEQLHEGVTILLWDQFTAEKELTKSGSADLKLTRTGAMTWAAMVRTGVIDPDTTLEAFAKACLDLGNSKTAPVDPTQPAASSESA